MSNRSERRAGTSILRTQTEELAGGVADAVRVEAMDTAGRIIEQSPATKALLHDVIEGVVRKTIQSPDFAKSLEKTCREAAIGCAEDILAELLPDLSGKVSEIVMARWDADVAQAARTVLDDHLAAVKARLR